MCVQQCTLSPRVLTKSCSGYWLRIECPLNLLLFVVSDELQVYHLSGKPENVGVFEPVGDFLKVGKSGKTGQKLFLVCCIIVSTWSFSYVIETEDCLTITKLWLALLFIITKSWWTWQYYRSCNTSSTGMIWVPLKIGVSAAHHQGIVGEFHKCLESGHSATYYIISNALYTVNTGWVVRQCFCRLW